MRVEGRQCGDVIVLNLEGDLSMFHASELAGLLNALIGKHQYLVVLNLAKIQEVDSVGMQAMRTGSSLFRRHNGDLILVSVPAPIRRVFELSGLVGSLQMFESVDDAVKSFHAA